MRIKINKKLLFGLTATLLISTSVVYAASSSDYFTKAKKYIDNNCAKSSLSNETSLNCYLFYKVMELEIKINSNTSRISALETVPTPTPIPTPVSKGVKIVDNNNVELGIYVDTTMFFYPPLERFVSFREIGDYDTAGLIYFTETDCIGNAYKTLNDGDMVAFGKFVFNAGDNRFFVVDGTTPNTSINTNSHLDHGSCINSNNTFSQRLLRQVDLPLPNPIAFPLHYRYQ